MKNLVKKPMYILLIGLMVVGGWSMANFAHARGGHGKGGAMPLKMLWNLDLSTEQKAAVSKLLPAYREEKDALREKMHAARETMQALMSADALDEDGIREASHNMAPIMEDMAVLRARFLFDLKDILSPEQVQKLQDRHQGPKHRRENHRRFREEMMDTWLQMPAGDTADVAESQP